MFDGSQIVRSSLTRLLSNLRRLLLSLKRPLPAERFFDRKSTRFSTNRKTNGKLNLSCAGRSFGSP
jgi:hypothetical protein